MAVDVSKIPNNNKFDPVREAILKLQSDIQSGVSGVGSINGQTGLITITDSGNITVGTSGTTITIGIDDSTYLTEEVNDLTAAVTWANVPDANITQSSVTQHQAALSITESQISDLQSYLVASDLDDYLLLTETGEQTISGDIVISGDLTVSGETTYINTNHLNIGDNIIQLNADIGGTTAPTEDAGFYVNRGSQPDASFLWDEDTDRFSTYANGLSTANLYIGSNQVINSSRQFIGSSTISSTVPYFTFSGDLNTGVGRATNNKVSLIAEGTKVLEASDTGVEITGDLEVSGTFTADGVTFPDDIITSADFSATDNRFKLTLTQADAGTIEASFDDVVLSESMAADYVPYIKVGGGDGDTTNAILNDSFLKINSSTLELDWGDTVGVYTARDIKMRSDGGGFGKYYESTYAASYLQFLHYESSSDIDTAKIGGTTTGRIRINDTYSLPVGDGTSGQVLSTNGSGDLSWADASSGGETARFTATSGHAFGDTVGTSRVVSFLNSTVAASNAMYLTIGKEESANNQAEISFWYVGDEDAGNQLRLGLYGDPDALTIDGNSHVSVTSGNFAVDAGVIKMGANTVIDSSRNSYFATTKSNYFFTDLNTTVSGVASKDWVYLGSGARGAGVIINDKDGARYSIQTGGYDLTFAKHISSSDTWSNVMRFESLGVDTDADVRILNDLTIDGSLNTSGGLEISGTATFDNVAVFNGQVNYNSEDRSTYWSYDDKVAAVFKPAADDGAVAILFPSIGNSVSDFGYIAFDEDYGEAGVTAGENSALIIGCENDGLNSSDHVRVKGRLVVEADMSSSDPTVAFDVKDGNNTDYLFRVNRSGSVLTGSTLNVADELRVDDAIRLTSNPTITGDTSGVYFWNQAGVGATIASNAFQVKTGGNTTALNITNSQDSTFYGNLHINANATNTISFTDGGTYTEMNADVVLRVNQRIEVWGGGTAATSYLDVRDQNGNRNIFLNGGGDSYFSNALGVGRTDADYKLDVSSSSATVFRAYSDGYANIDIESARTNTGSNIGGIRWETEGDTYKTSEINALVDGGLVFRTGTGSSALSTAVTIGANNSVDVAGVHHANEYRLQSTTDPNHYLKKITTGYSGVTIDGAQLQGHQGGELSTNYTGNNWALRWATGGNVYINNNLGIGIATASHRLHIDSNSNSTYPTGWRAGELRVANDNTSNVPYQTANIVLSATGWAGGTTGVAQLSVIQDGSNVSNGTFTIKVRQNGTHYEAFRIKYDGKVGIGTTSPAYKLDVNGTTRASQFVSLVNNNRSGVGVRDWLLVGTYDRAGAIEIGDVAGARYGIWGGGYDLTFGKHISTTDTYTNVMQFLASNATDSSVDVVFTSGSVGIGTTSPSYKLDVNGGLRVGTSSTVGELNFTTNNLNYIHYSGGDCYFRVNGGKMYFEGSAGFRGAWDNSGNLGIGTTSPQAKLDVNGTVLLGREHGVTQLHNNKDYNNMASGLVWREYNATGTYAHATSSTTLSDYIKAYNFTEQGIASTVDSFTRSDDTYAVEFVGYYYANVDGIHEFSASSDDSSDFFIDGTRVAYWYGGHGDNNAPTGGTGQVAGSIYLVKGFHRLYARFQEGTGGDSISLWQKEPSGSWEKIPSTRFFHKSDDLFRATGSGNATLYGTFTATADIVAYSDERIKDNIETIDNALDKVNQLRGVSFNRKSDGKESIGVIAQEVEKILPEVVTEDDKGIKGVSYGNIVGVLIEAMKEQQKQIDELKARLDA